jgi:peptide/nickel transport system permease protein
MMTRSLARNRAAQAGIAIFVVTLVCAVFASVIAPYDPIIQNTAVRLQGPSAAHLMGTDDFGRDLFSRVIYGARTSVVTGVVATGTGLLIGTVLGLAGGFYGGRVDRVVSAVSDIMLSFPYILLAILIVAIIGPGLVNVMLAVGVSRVPIFTRLVRSAVLGVKTNEYVVAATSVGASNVRIITKHVFPNIAAALIVQASSTMAEAIVTASALNFLGLGVQPPTPDWGAMVSEGRRFIFDRAYIPLFPGLAITALVLSLNLIGDWLRDVLDPRLRGLEGAGAS